MKNRQKEDYIIAGVISGILGAIIGIWTKNESLVVVSLTIYLIAHVIGCIWYYMIIRNCTSIKQNFCKCEDIEIIKEWENFSVKFGKCKKCGKYFSINEKDHIMVSLTEEEYEKQLKIFTIMQISQVELNMLLEEMDKKARELCGIEDKESKQ